MVFSVHTRYILFVIQTHRLMCAQASRPNGDETERNLPGASVGVSDVDTDGPVGEDRDRLGAEVDDRHDDGRDGDGREGARAPRTVGLLAQQPDKPLPVAGRHFSPLDDEAFLLLELADDRLVHLVKL